MKRKYIIIGALIVLILGLVVADFVINPISGTSYDLLDVRKEQITAVEIHHYGKGLTLTHPEYVAQLVDLFDCNLERRGNDYLTNRTGGDWGITFLAKNGSQSKSFLFFPGNGSGETKLKIGHYYYAADIDITNALLESLFFDTSITGQVKEAIETAYLDYFSDALGMQVKSLDGILSLDSTKDGRVYHYYGTFQDAVVWFCGKLYREYDIDKPYSVQLAGCELYSPTPCDFLAAKNGQYYTLEEAYELGFVKDEDIAIIAKRHTLSNQILLDISRPTGALEDAATPIKELIIDPEIAAEIAQADYTYVKEHYGAEPARMLMFGEGLTEEIYYGTFDDAVVWFQQGNADAEENFKVAGYPFYFPNSFNINIYENGIFYSMEEAYLRGILSVADISIISQRHIQMLNACLYDEPVYFFHKNHYDVIQGADGDVVFRPVSKSDLDYMMAEVIDGDSHGLIVSATVTGGSYNNLTLSEPYSYILSNVYTPIRIDHIYSKGSSVNISVGETCYLNENYFYITDQLPGLVNDSGKDAIYLRGADPLIFGQKYILYLYDMEKPPIVDLGSGTEQVLFPVANNLYAFPVGTKEEAEQALLDPSDAYWKAWQEVLATYIE